MLLFSNESEGCLSDDDRAAAINLAFLLDITNYNKELLSIISKELNEKEKCNVYKFWANLTPTTARAYFCMAEYEGRI